MSYQYFQIKHRLVCFACQCCWLVQLPGVILRVVIPKKGFCPRRFVNALWEKLNKHVLIALRAV